MPNGESTVGGLAMGAAGCVLAFVLACGPLSAQVDEQRAEAVAAALEHVLGGIPVEIAPSEIVLDTLRTAAGAAGVATHVARDLGLTPGISEDHCRRIHIDHRNYPIGVEVRGVEAIAQASFEMFTPDSAYVWVWLFRGSGRYLSGGSSYRLRRDPAGWQVKHHLSASHALCQPRLFPIPVALAVESMMGELGSRGPSCLDATGFPLRELDLVAEIVGAEIRGEYVPPPRTGWVPWPPEPYANPCEKADARSGSVLRVVDVEWESDEVIHVTLEGRRTGARQPNEARERLVRYTLLERGGGWKISEQAVLGAVNP